MPEVRQQYKQEHIPMVVLVADWGRDFDDAWFDFVDG